MMLARDTFCSFCGAAYAAAPAAYPRTCAACGTTVWANPVPVAVVLVPVAAERRTGLLVIRRAIEPHVGKLALVGGFVEDHETWQEAGAREVREEAGLAIAPDAIAPFWFTSTAPRPNRVLLFGVAPAIAVDAMASFAPNREVSERGLVFGPDGLDEVFAFPLHAAAARRFFADAQIAGAHDYRTA